MKRQGTRTFTARIEVTATVTAHGYYDEGRWGRPEDSYPEEGECEIESLTLLGHELPQGVELPEEAVAEIEEAFFDALRKEEDR
jgi:hypothetical protein